MPFINYFFSNIGVYPIDTFSFFDSGYLITKGYHPIRDFWVISGLLIDYIQALFFLIFGNNWNGVTDFFQNPDIGISNSMQRRPYVDADNYGLQSSNFRGAGLPAQAARAGYSVEQFNALPIHEQRLFTD